MRDARVTNAADLARLTCERLERGHARELRLKQRLPVIRAIAHPARRRILAPATMSGDQEICPLAGIFTARSDLWTGTLAFRAS